MNIPNENIISLSLQIGVSKNDTSSIYGFLQIASCDGKHYQRTKQFDGVEHKWEEIPAEIFAELNSRFCKPKDTK